MNEALLDTCIIIDYLRQKPDAVVYLEKLSAMPCLASVTLMELYAGVRGKREEAQIENLIRYSNVLDITAEIGIQAGKFLSIYRASHNIDAIDAIIAATAVLHKLEPVTLNLKHFPMFEKLERPY